MNPFPVLTYSVFLEADPIGTTASFRFGVSVQIQQGGPLIPLKIETMEEFMAVTSVLQIPNGQLMFRPTDQMLLKQF